MNLGLLNLPWWGYVLVTLALTHITIVSVTIFLHRNQAHRALAAVKLWLHGDVKRVPQQERAILEQALRSSTVLSTIDSMRKELIGVWSRTTASNEQMVKHLEDWCRRAEASGIGALRDFSRKLRRYDALLGDM
jgi:hypothetical protein